MNLNELKAARIRRGISSKEMAQKLNITPAHYSYIENGKRYINLATANKIVQALNLGINELLLIFFDSCINSNDNSINNIDIPR